MKILHVPVVLEQDEDGLIVASAPTLRGCHTQGATVEEAMANIKEAIELALEVREERDAPENGCLIGLREGALLAGRRRSVGRAVLCGSGGGVVRNQV